MGDDCFITFDGCTEFNQEVRINAQKITSSYPEADNFKICKHQIQFSQ